MTADGADPGEADPADPGPGDHAPHGDDDHLEEIRQAAGAVVASLKWLIDATERVIEDPEAFSQAVDNGKSVVESFLGGFMEHAGPNTDGEESDADS